MAEGDMGDLEDNQPDSSAPEDEQTEHSPHQPIGEYDYDDDDDDDNVNNNINRVKCINN